MNIIDRIWLSLQRSFRSEDEAIIFTGLFTKGMKNELFNIDPDRSMDAIYNAVFHLPKNITDLNDAFNYYDFLDPFLSDMVMRVLLIHFLVMINYNDRWKKRFLPFIKSREDFCEKLNFETKALLHEFNDSLTKTRYEISLINHPYP